MTIPEPTTARNQLRGDAAWWRQAVVYQVYPRSFADANGDGLGDLAGVVSRVPYLQRLGVDAVWLSPFYPSELADGGYDVADYRDVDPRLGTLDDFDALVVALHGVGIRVIVDIVPNHTSDQHAWFQEALAAAPGSHARERYLFREGRGEHGELPPTDWQSLFGGSAWERLPDGQWYLHLFTKEQPDLNWAEREVRDDFLTTLAFWSDRGVDGFRIDVAHGLTKDLTGDLSGPLIPAEPSASGTDPIWDRDEVQDVYAEWRGLLNRYDPPRTAVAEAWVHPDRRARYASPDSLGQAFNFDLLEAAWSASAFRSVIDGQLKDAERSGSSTTWVLSNHDVVRHATRYGLPQQDDDPESAAPAAAAPAAAAWLRSRGTDPKLDRDLGERRARAATMLMLALPGAAYLYQGEELGLHEVAEIPDAQRQDPAFFRSGTQVGRDGCRVPLPWAPTGPSFGFGSGEAHLPQPAWFAQYAVSREEEDTRSTLALYRAALRLRHELQAGEQLEWVPNTPGAVVAFRRPDGWTSITNFGAEPVPLAAEPLLSSAPLIEGRLPQAATAWLR